VGNEELYQDVVFETKDPLTREFLFILSDFSLMNNGYLTFTATGKSPNGDITFRGCWIPEGNHIIAPPTSNLKKEVYERISVIKLPEETAKELRDIQASLSLMCKTLEASLADKIVSGIQPVELFESDEGYYTEYLVRLPSEVVQDLYSSRIFKDYDFELTVLQLAQRKFLEKRELSYNLLLSEKFVISNRKYLEKLFRGDYPDLVRRITRNDWGHPISCEVEYEDLFNPMLLAQVERVDSKTGKTVKGPKFYSPKDRAIFNSKRKLVSEVEQRDEELRQKLQVKVLASGADGSSPDNIREVWKLVEVKDPQTNESLRFVCRHIRDKGFIINPDYPIKEGLPKGGMFTYGIKPMWRKFSVDGNVALRELTPFEWKCVSYLRRFNPIDLSPYRNVDNDIQKRPSQSQDDITR